MVRLVIRLNRNRDHCGTLALEDGTGRVLCGPFAVAARASDAAAREQLNPSRDPLLCFGDTPSGRYRVGSILKSGAGTAYEADHYGPHGLVVLDPVAGDAALAEANGRFHIFIQGGAAAAHGRLRSTNGALRLTDDDQKALVAALSENEGLICDCLEDPHVSGDAVVIDDSCRDGDPPPLLGGKREGAQLLRREYSRRNLLLAGAATVGGIALGGPVFSLFGDGVRWTTPAALEGVAMAYESPSEQQQSAPTSNEPPAGPSGATGPAGPAPESGPVGPGPGSVEAPVSAPGATGPTAPNINLPPGWKNPVTGGSGGNVPGPVEVGPPAVSPPTSAVGQPANPPIHLSRPLDSGIVPAPGSGPSSAAPSSSAPPASSSGAPSSNPFPTPPPGYQHLKNPLIDYNKNPNPNNDPDVQQGIQQNYNDYQKNQQ